MRCPVDNTNHLIEKVILVVEDDYDIGDILEKYLKRENMQVLRATNGQQALEYHLKQPIDLIILDVKLPLLNGWEVLASVRYRGNTPVIMLTALDQDIDKVMALRVGADDYVVKPFNPNEVIARVQAVLRRSQTTPPSKRTQFLHYRNIEINLESHSVYIHQDQKRLPLNITLTEYKILVLLMGSPYKVFTRSELMLHCLPESEALERTVDSHLSKLRKKIEDAGVTDLINNVRGVGYRLDKQV